MERRRKLPSEAIWVAIGIPTIIGIGNIAVNLVHHVNPTDSYEQSYSNSGKCLSKTPYSEINGARLGQTALTQDGNYQFSVTPAKTGINLPPLVFNVNYGHLSAANQFTLHYLTGNNCKSATGN